MDQLHSHPMASTTTDTQLFLGFGLSHMKNMLVRRMKSSKIDRFCRSQQVDVYYRWLGWTLSQKFDYTIKTATNHLRRIRAAGARKRRNLAPVSSSPQLQANTTTTVTGVASRSLLLPTDIWNNIGEFLTFQDVRNVRVTTLNLHYYIHTTWQHRIEHAIEVFHLSSSVEIYTVCTKLSSRHYYRRTGQSRGDTGDFLMSMMDILFFLMTMKNMRTFALRLPQFAKAIESKLDAMENSELKILTRHGNYDDDDDDDLTMRYPMRHICTYLRTLSYQMTHLESLSSSSPPMGYMPLQRQFKLPQISKRLPQTVICLTNTL